MIAQATDQKAQSAAAPGDRPPAPGDRAPAPGDRAPAPGDRAAAPGAFTIEPQGPFSWNAGYDFFHGFRPLLRPGDSSPSLRTAFILDGTLEPVAVEAWWEDGVVAGRVVGQDETGEVAPGTLVAARNQLARILSLDIDGTEFPRVAERDPALKPVFEALPGLRPVLFLSPYECAAWAVISLRINARQAAAVQQRLTRDHGTRFDLGDGETWAFPAPRQMLEVRQVPGLADFKLERLHGVARTALDGKLDADELRALGEERALAQLRTIPGIGEFWASGIYVRACGVADAFPMEPLSIAALGTLHGRGERPDPGELAAISDLHRPFRMWVVFLLRVAAARGIIPGLAGRETEIRRAARRA